MRFLVSLGMTLLRSVRSVVILNLDRGEEPPYDREGRANNDFPNILFLFCCKNAAF